MKRMTAISNDIIKLEEQIHNLEKRTEALEGWKASEASEAFLQLEEIREESVKTKKENYAQDEFALNLKNNNEVLEMQQKQLQNLEKKMEGYLLLESRIKNLESNISNNNKLIEYLSDKNSEKEGQDGEIRRLVNDLVKRVLELGRSGIVNNESVRKDTGTANDSGATNPPAENMDAPKENTYEDVDYFDFENHFRGKRENIKKAQEIYLPYFESCQSILDLGCGRGEFLELLKDRGIKARGVDFYPEFVEYCKMRGLDVCYGDAIEYLADCDSAGGIFAGQLVEHLQFNQIVRLCKLAYEKLSVGGYLIMETPNPTSLAIYTQSFYKDPSHVKPIHPMTLEYVAKKAGFEEIEILYTEVSRVPVKIPELNEKIDESVSEFNKVMRYVSDILFGSQDYAIIAKK